MVKYVSNVLFSGGAIRYFTGLLLIVPGTASMSGCATWSTSSIDSKEADATTMVSKKTPIAQIRITDTDEGLTEFKTTAVRIRLSA